VYGDAKYIKEDIVAVCTYNPERRK
jgi:hypothetical protein